MLSPKLVEFNNVKLEKFIVDGVEKEKTSHNRPRGLRWVGVKAELMETDAVTYLLFQKYGEKLTPRKCVSLCAKIPIHNSALLHITGGKTPLPFGP